MTSSFSFQAALERMLDEFYYAGHTSLSLQDDDDDDAHQHPLHALWVEARRLLEFYFPELTDDSDFDAGELAQLYIETHAQLCRARVVYAANAADRAQKLEQLMPRHAVFLVLRFATADKQENKGLVDLLALCDSLHLWRVPSAGDRLEPAAQRSDSEDENRSRWDSYDPDEDEDGSSGDGYDPNEDEDGYDPTEADSSIEAALKQGLEEAARKGKAIQDTKKELQSQLAVVEEAEAAVLKAQDALTQAQAAMAQADLVLLQSPFSILAMDH